MRLERGVIFVALAAWKTRILIFAILIPLGVCDLLIERAKRKGGVNGRLTGRQARVLFGKLRRPGSCPDRRHGTDAARAQGRGRDPRPAGLAKAPRVPGGRISSKRWIPAAAGPVPAAALGHGLCNASWFC
jgi:hypothetical protein